MDILKVLLVLNTVLVVLLIALVYLLARYIGDFIAKIESIRGIKIGSLMIGDKAPNFREIDQNGSKIISNQLYRSGTTLLLFVKTTCPVCKTILQGINVIQSHYDLNLVVINTDESSDDANVVEHLNEKVIYIKSNQLSQSFSIQSVPNAILVNSEGHIDSIGELKNKKSLLNLLINEKTFDTP